MSYFFAHSQGELNSMEFSINGNDWIGMRGHQYWGKIDSAKALIPGRTNSIVLKTKHQSDLLFHNYVPKRLASYWPGMIGIDSVLPPNTPLQLHWETDNYHLHGQVLLQIIFKKYTSFYWTNIAFSAHPQDCKLELESAIASLWKRFSPK
ncbi:MAG: hypothetical protein ACK417_01250, partial [Bacteroidia bacterium]